MERRFIDQSQSTVRVEDTGRGQTISGLASVYYNGNPNTEYRFEIGGIPIAERILEGAFDKAIAQGDDVVALYNHNPDALLGRASANTLQLRSEKAGLRYTIPVDADDPDHQRVIPKFKRGDLTGSSFAFSNPIESWSTEERDGVDVDVREITSLTLHDVGPVTFPAYEKSTSGVRNNEDTTEAQASHKAWKASQAAIKRVAELS